MLNSWLAVDHLRNNVLSLLTHQLFLLSTYTPYCTSLWALSAQECLQGILCNNACQNETFKKCCKQKEMDVNLNAQHLIHYIKMTGLSISLPLYLIECMWLLMENFFPVSWDMDSWLRQPILSYCGKWFDYEIQTVKPISTFFALSSVPS